ncbi:MAG: hypothetical protein ACRD21_08515 [Vicinamibacteria bacterium]
MPKPKTFELDFKTPTEGQKPFSPHAQILVKTFTQDAPDGMPIVTPRCSSFGEFKAAVEGLIDELETLKKKVKPKFKEKRKGSSDKE